MIKNLLLIFSVIFSCNLVNAQQQTPTAPELRQVTTQNGVVVYESGGVEGFQPAIADNNSPAAVKPISEWDLQQCNESLYYLEQKLAVVTFEGNQEAIQRYQQNKIEILTRKSILTNQNSGE